MSVNEAKEYAKNRLPIWGMDQNEFGSLDQLWTAESGWNYKAFNKKTKCAGIPQIKGGADVPNFMNDYTIQIEHGLSYIKNRYSTPSKAWAFHQKNGWY